MVDGVAHEVEKGSAVFIPGDAEHGVRNEGAEELKWLYVFPVGNFGEIVYRFEGEGWRKVIPAKL
jgi:quercetin dioxygenase-like cupin family protein